MVREWTRRKVNLLSPEPFRLEALLYGEDETTLPYNVASTSSSPRDFLSTKNDPSSRSEGTSNSSINYSPATYLEQSSFGNRSTGMQHSFTPQYTDNAVFPQSHGTAYGTAVDYTSGDGTQSPGQSVKRPQT